MTFAGAGDAPRDGRLQPGERDRRRRESHGDDRREGGTLRSPSISTDAFDFNGGAGYP